MSIAACIMAKVESGNVAMPASWGVAGTCPQQRELWKSLVFFGGRDFVELLSTAILMKRKGSEKKWHGTMYLGEDREWQARRESGVETDSGDGFVGNDKSKQHE